MSEQQKQTLEKQLWNIANELRGKMNADEFRDYILGFIFYKYLSEKMELFADQKLEPDNIKYEELTPETENYEQFIEAVKKLSTEELGYFLYPTELFGYITKKGNHQIPVKAGEKNTTIIEDLKNILNGIEKSTMGTDSEDDFNNLFADLRLDDTRLGRSDSERNKLIAKILTHLDKIDFQLNNSQIDVLGDAYEYLIGKFAATAGKSAGEFYTPQEVSKILAKIVTTNKERLQSVYDPTCGSGSLLLRVAKEVKEVANYYGQESNVTTYNLARMNMILHGVHYSHFDIKQEDTLERPQHLDKKFEAIVANPPFSAKWSASPLFMSDDRFSQYGKLAPSSKADFAFIQHMLYQLADNGMVAVVAPHGVLFRGASEGHIRKHIIKELNYLDTVIGLPANIFFGTSIPTCILVFQKCRKDDKHILFVDASNYFEKAKNQNYLREEDINKIITTYRDRAVVDKYSYLAPLSEIADNDYNLNIPRYVDTSQQEQKIDINAVAKQIKKLESEIKGIDDTIASYCQRLNIATPF